MGSIMIDAAKCEELANHYKVLSQASGVSADRAFLLKNIARSLTGVASQLDRLAALTRDEGNRTGPRDAFAHANAGHENLAIMC